MKSKQEVMEELSLTNYNEAEKNRIVVEQIFDVRDTVISLLERIIDSLNSNNNYLMNLDSSLNYIKNNNNHIPIIKSNVEEFKLVLSEYLPMIASYLKPQPVTIVKRQRVFAFSGIIATIKRILNKKISLKIYD